MKRLEECWRCFHLSSCSVVCDCFRWTQLHQDLELQLISSLECNFDPRCLCKESFLLNINIFTCECDKSTKSFIIFFLVFFQKVNNNSRKSMVRWWESKLGLILILTKSWKGVDYFIFINFNVLSIRKFNLNNSFTFDIIFLSENILFYHFEFPGSDQFT